MASLLLVGVVAVAARAAVRRRSLALSMLALNLGLYYGLRAAVVGLGLDTLFPSYLFDTSASGALALRLAAVLAVYVAATLFAHGQLGTVAAVAAGALPTTARQPSTRLLAVAAAVASIAAAAVAVQLLARFGSFDGALQAAKVEQALVGGNSFLLRVPSGVGAALAAVGLARSWERRQWYWGTCFAALLLVSAAATYLFGSRQVAVVTAGFVVALPILRRVHEGAGLDRRAVVRVGAALLVVATLVVGLRLTRDAALGQTASAVSSEGTSLARQLTLSSNAQTYDASLLVLRDWPAVQPYRGGQDFVEGLVGALPGPLRPIRIDPVTLGAEVRRTYQPWTVNGWPVGAPVEWWMNLGWLGVVLGGLATGVTHRAVDVALRRDGLGALNVMVAVLVTTLVVPLGWQAVAPNRFLRFVVPLWGMVWIAGLLRSDQSPRRLDRVDRPAAAVRRGGAG